MPKNESIAKQFNIGFLSTIDHPLLPYFLRSTLNNGCQNIVVLCDSKTETVKDKEIWYERTRGIFEDSNGDCTTLYALTEAKIPFYFVENHNSPQMLDIIQTFQIDCLFNAGTPRRLSSNIIESVNYGVINIHPGILPKYRGCTCVEWAILNDDKVGNTAHFMDSGYDTGPIISTEWYEFRSNADYVDIRKKVYQSGCEFAGKVLKQIQNERMTPSKGTQQRLEDGKHWKPVSKNDMDLIYQKLASRSYKYQCL